jgi:hypothetical protein
VNVAIGNIVILNRRVPVKMSAPLLPTQIPGCQVWLDANDGSTYTLTGGLVSSWADKSGNGNNFSQGAATRYPSINGAGINNLSTLYFTGPSTSPNTTSKFLSNASIQPNVTSYSIFTVAKRDSTAPSATGYNYIIDGNVSSDFFLFYGGGPSGNYATFAGTGGGWNDVNQNSPAYSVTNSFIGSMIISGSVLTPYFNGSNQNTKVGTTTAYSGLSIGEPQPNNHSGQNWNGLVGEVIIYTSALNSTQRQQVEGYLAWKWGLQGSLPTGHLYKNSPPTLPIVNTTSELILLNSLAQSGTVYFPSTLTAGRILTFKDTRGSFPVSTMTLAPFITGQTFENNTTSQTFTEAFGAYSFIAGFDNKWYTIGGSRMFAATISSITTILLTSQNISTGNITTSTLQFRDIATRSTNTLFSLSTNVYMSSPTNFFILGPTKAPKPLFIPTSRPFAPNQISGLILWLDAADVNSLVLSGTSVIEWRDKSGNRTNLTVSAGTPRLGTFNGLNSIFFNGAARMVRNNFTGLQSVQHVNWFVVANPSSVNLNYGLLIGTMYTTNNSQSDMYILTNTIQIYYRITPPTGVNKAVSTPITGGNAMIASSFVNLQNGTYGAFYNGVGTTASDGYIGSQDSSVVNLFVGNDNFPGDDFITGTISECLLYTQALTTIQRQQIEGYLAWKWGLVGTLPSTHPYKNSPP